MQDRQRPAGRGLDAPILAITTAQEARSKFSWDSLWQLFDGDRERMNLAHECLDRHRERGQAVSVQFADGHAEHYSFAELSDSSSRFANWLEQRGVGPGERVAVMLEPGRAFYTALFGAVKRGAIAVPLFTLFGPEGLALRIEDCRPSLIVTLDQEGLVRERFPDLPVVRADGAFWDELAAMSSDYVPTTAANDLAIFQYTSGTTRELPDAVKHTHRSAVTVMIAALYGVGLKPGDRYFCPSSPAWGHGLWHGTISPLVLGIHIGAYSGRFEAQRIFEALQNFQVDNFAAAPTVFRMLRNAGMADRYRIDLKKISFTGEPMDDATFDWVERTFGVAPASMYGSTEVGVLIVNFPGYPDHKVRRGALGQAAPGQRVDIVDRDGRILPAGETGEIALARKDGWFFVKDRGRRDGDGYFYHEGRSDDVIISAGWTMSAVEIENALLRHPDILEAAVIGVPDAVRGQVPKAFLVRRESGGSTVAEIQQFLKTQLSQHEYPRHIEYVTELPKTPAGKINRKVLRDREAATRAGA